MQPRGLSIIIQSLIDQKKISEALKLTSAAQSYHQFGDIKDIQFIKELEDKINGIDNTEEMRVYYNSIFGSKPEKLIKIFPENLNGRTELIQFFVKEIILAADKLLDKIMSLSEIGDENKYNDLMELALDARINPWGWQIGAQSRGAFSSGVQQPGERDITFTNRLKQTMFVCEAFIFRDVKRTKEHLQKVFNYHHQRKAFAMLVYNESDTDADFQKKSENYMQTILPTIIFPAGFNLAGTAKDLSKEFAVEKSAIKVYASEHGDGTMLYHVFVHIKYRLALN
jgi:hypothetical protein